MKKKSRKESIQFRERSLYLKIINMPSRTRICQAFRTYNVNAWPSPLPQTQIYILIHIYLFYLYGIKKRTLHWKLVLGGASWLRIALRLPDWQPCQETCVQVAHVLAGIHQFCKGWVFLWGGLLWGTWGCTLAWPTPKHTQTHTQGETMGWAICILIFDHNNLQCACHRPRRCPKAATMPSGNYNVSTIWFCGTFAVRRGRWAEAHEIYCHCQAIIIGCAALARSQHKEIIIITKSALVAGARLTVNLYMNITFAASSFCISFSITFVLRFQFNLYWVE